MCLGTEVKVPCCYLPHTLQGSAKSPMQYIQDAPPIKVHGLTVASTGSEWSVSGNEGMLHLALTRPSTGQAMAWVACCLQCRLLTQQRAPHHAGDDPALGAPVEYICLKGSTKEHPAVCKYTGNKYYSDDWIGGGAH